VSEAEAVVRDLVARAEQAELIEQADEARARIRRAHEKLFRRSVRHDRPIAELEADLKFVEVVAGLDRIEEKES